jgi:hypothetical protein
MNHACQNKMEKLRIKFVDFWEGFDAEQNFFSKLLRESYDLEYSDNPEILIYSCYGRKYLEYRCTRIFYTPDNVRPDFSGCDYAITFDYSKHPRHYRLPLYAMYIDQIANVEHLTRPVSREEAAAIWKSKSKFCCMVVSNGQSKRRLNFFEKLSKYKRVDSGGRVLNNIGEPVTNKMKFIKDYRFVISFENASYPGYTTEKIIEPLMADCIPLYWGDPLVNTEFDKGCFLQLTDDNTEEQLISEIMAIDKNEEKAIDILCAPKFVGNRIPDSIVKDNLMLFFMKMIKDSKDRQPVAKKIKGHWHKYAVKARYYQLRLAGLMKQHF